MILVRQAPTVECLMMSTLLRLITPHVGITRLLVSIVVPLVPVDDVSSVIMLESVVLAFGKVVAILPVPDTILVPLPDGRVALKSVEGLVPKVSLVHPVFTSVLILFKS